MNDTPERGHPRGLYRLFFTEMWERLAFYTMLNVLLLYVTDTERGGLGLSAGDGNEIYGLYLAFVYFTPFPGGMIADRFIGYRLAVLIGGLLMSSGLLLMSIAGTSFFMLGLILLVLGNGFFKPNISVMVGNLYQKGDPRRDAGFNIFYMGINIGAFIASFLSSAVRNQAGWLWTFRVAGIGLLIGVTILLFSWRVLAKADRKPEVDPDDMGLAEIARRIFLPSLVAGVLGAVAMKYAWPGGPVRPAVAGFLAGMIPVVLFFRNLVTRAKPEEKPGLMTLFPVYLAGGTFFMVLHLNGSAMTQWARDSTDRRVDIIPLSYTISLRPVLDFEIPINFEQEALPRYYLNAGEDTPRPDPRSLTVASDDAHARMYGQQRLNEEAVAAILAAAHGELTAREFAVDANTAELSEVDQALYARSASVYEQVTIEEETDSHGHTQLTVKVEDGAKPTRRVAFVRDVEGHGSIGAYVVDAETHAQLYDGYQQTFGHAPETLPPGQYLKVANPELYQSLNALFVVGLTPLLVLFFARLSKLGYAVSTARKIFFGMSLTTLSLILMAVAGLFTAGGAAKVSGLWLVGFYMVITLGELMLSPMGLSLVTKLAPKRLVGLAMGGWFLATAFGNNF
ncbi:MAG: peptide MFS transporter, partial [Myxococcales bacterium]|nr:peptide MFS transporter [Myxococcales bacterium]